MGNERFQKRRKMAKMKEKVFKFIVRHIKTKGISPQDEDKMCGKIGISTQEFRKLFPKGLQQAIDEAKSH